MDELLRESMLDQAAGLLTDAEARGAVAAIQKAMKDDLKAGRVLLQNMDNLKKKYPFLTGVFLAGIAANQAEADQIAEAQTDLLFELAEHSHPGVFVRATTYTGKEGLLGWLGWAIDLINPGDDIATAYDIERLIHIFDGGDPTEPSGYDKMRQDFIKENGWDPAPIIGPKF